MAAIVTLDPRESLFQITTLAELLHGIVNHRSPKSEILFVLLRVDPFELVEIAVNNLEKRRSFGVSGMVDSVGRRSHDDSPLRNKYYTRVQYKTQGEIIRRGRFAKDILDAMEVI